MVKLLTNDNNVKVRIKFIAHITVITQKSYKDENRNTEKE